jgi:hypothetical protein
MISDVPSGILHNLEQIGLRRNPLKSSYRTRSKCSVSLRVHYIARIVRVYGALWFIESWKISGLRVNVN